MLMQYSFVYIGTTVKLGSIGQGQVAANCRMAVTKHFQMNLESFDVAHGTYQNK